jgi:hypothetical protein
MPLKQEDELKSMQAHINMLLLFKIPQLLYISYSWNKTKKAPFWLDLWAIQKSSFVLAWDGFCFPSSKDSWLLTTTWAALFQPKSGSFQSWASFYYSGEARRNNLDVLSQSTSDVLTHPICGLIFLCLTNLPMSLGTGEKWGDSMLKLTKKIPMKLMSVHFPFRVMMLPRIKFAFHFPQPTMNMGLGLANIAPTRPHRYSSISDSPQNFVFDLGLSCGTVWGHTCTWVLRFPDPQSSTDQEQSLWGTQKIKKAIVLRIYTEGDVGRTHSWEQRKIITTQNTQILFCMEPQDRTFLFQVENHPDLNLERWI